MRQCPTSALLYHWFRGILLVSELRAVLQPNVLSELLQRCKVKEVGAAELENLMICLFWPYVTITDNE